MYFIKILFLGFCSGTFGIAVAGGFLALISMIGIVPRLASMTKTVDHILTYENALIYGAFLGALLSSYSFKIPFGPIIPMATGLFGGAFVGCLAGALAEVVNVLPIMSRRAGIRKGIPYIIYALAVGKGVGVFVQYFILSRFQG